MGYLGVWQTNGPQRLLIPGVSASIAIKQKRLCRSNQLRKLFLDYPDESTVITMVFKRWKKQKNWRKYDSGSSGSGRKVWRCYVNGFENGGRVHKLKNTGSLHRWKRQGSEVLHQSLWGELSRTSTLILAPSSLTKTVMMMWSLI